MNAVLLPLVLLPLQPAADASPPVGLNLSGVRDYASEFPFIDVFRSARTWVAQRDGGKWGSGEPLDLRPDGYPARLKPGQFATAILLNAPGYPTGTYTLRFDGQGRFELNGDAEVTSKSSGRWEVAIGPNPNFLLHVRETDPVDPLRNFRLYMPGFEGDGEAGIATFAPAFVDRCRRFACLRFMDWGETNNSEIATWDDRPKVDDFSWSSHGVPIETMCELSNEAATDAWFCVPHLADDDYVRRMAETIRDTLDAPRRVYIEHSNEVWNGQFAQARYAGDTGQKRGLSDNRYQAQLRYHAKRSGEIFAIFDDVLGEDRVVCVLGAQSVNPWTTEQVVSDPSVTARADAVAIAPYFGGRLGDPKTAAEVARMSNDELAERCRESIRENAAAIAKTKTICDAHGLDLIAYEAGQHLVGRQGSENNEALTAAFHRLNRDAAMKTLYVEAYESWAENGGGLWCAFASVARPSKWGSWGLKEYDDQPDAEAPKWQAIDTILKRAAAQ